MRLPVSDLPSLDKAIAQGYYSDYIYMYPPRQAYRNLTSKAIALRASLRRSLTHQTQANLYIHVPFCAQICRFCNLYTTTVRAESIFESYVSRVIAEAAAYADEVLASANVEWRTLYFGGGTPSALPLEQLERLMAGVKDKLRISATEEIAIEVAPEIATTDYLSGLRQLGFDRVSMGFQSTADAEIRLIGRNYPVNRQATLADATRELGFGNLCLDLIFGLPGQTRESWLTSLRSVIQMRPQTVCCYQWTQRPGTGFARMGLSRPPGRVLHEMYEAACDELANAGYRQETHVRWIVEGGGYLQKLYHWGLGNLVGLGAGARSYSWNLDLRNGYSIRNRRGPLETYLESTGLGWDNSPYGFTMSVDERIRKAVILNLHNLDRKWFSELFDVDIMSAFGTLLAGLEQRDLLEILPDNVRLTAKGMAHRDSIVQLFFSGNVRRLTEEWTYAE